jgi:hypothetical protein
MSSIVAQRVAGLVGMSLIVGGCATPGGMPGTTDGQPGAPGQVSLDQVCNPFVVGATAAAVCAAVVTGNNRVRAGASCAAVAMTACYLANSYQARQTRSASQVQEDFLKANRQLPERATVTAYNSEITPRGAVSRGQEVQLTSTIVAVPGRSDRNILIEEEIGVVDSRGEVWGRPVRKVANSGNQAGEFRTSFTIPVSNGMSQGVYVLKRSLYVNGAAVQKDNMGARFQVVQAGVGEPVAALKLPDAR